jgi:hypothetical protein
MKAAVAWQHRMRVELADYKANEADTIQVAILDRIQENGICLSRVTIRQ